MKKRFVSKTRSISTELAVSLFILVLLVEGILLWIVYSRQSHFLHQELERKADVYASNLGEVLGVPIWNFDTTQIENIGLGYTQNEIVNGLYIRDSDGITLFDFHKPQNTENHIRRYANITYENQVIGNAELFISIDTYDADLAWLRNLIVLILTGSLLVIFIATGFLLRIYIRRPMSVLQNGIDQVAKGDYAYNFDDIYHQELSGIANRFKEMANEIQNREKSLKNEVIERKRTEASLHRSEAQNRLLLEQMHGIVWAVDKDLRFTSSRGAGLAKIGLKPDQIVGQTLQEFLGSDKAQAISAVQQAFKGQSVTYEEDWGGIPWESRVEPLRDHSGQIVGSITMSLDITERKRAEETLHKYAHIVSATSDLMSFVDRNYIYQAVNQSYLKYHDKSYEEIIGHSIADLHGADFFNQEIKKEIDKSLSGQKINYQIWVDYPGYGGRYMDVIYNPYTDELGNISGVVVNARDKTEQKKAQEALQESEEKYRLLFDNADVLVSVYDRKGVCQLMNRKVAKLFGGQQHDFIGKSFQELHPKATDEYKRRIRLAIDTGESHEYEDEVAFPGGKRWLLSRVHPVPGPENVSKTAQIISHDITERKQTEAELSKTSTRLQMALNSAKIGLWENDLRTGESYVSKEWKRQLGLEGKEVPDPPKEWEQRLHPEDREPVLALWSAYLAGKQTDYTLEFRLRHEDGSYRWILSKGQSYFDKNGQPIRTMGCHIDISDRKEAEEELKRHREHLEELVEDRTAQLEKEINVRRTAERQIAASLAEKEVLLREIHHRVKNNLNTVSNLLYLQSRTLEDARIEGAFRESRNRIQTMARVHELLHRSETLAEIDMNTYIKELTADLSATYQHRSELLATDASGVTLEIDRAIPCGLIITELVSNSLKYAFAAETPEDRISVELAVQGDEYRLTVADNGCGLPEGLNIEQTRSLGLRLVGMLTRQLHGSLEIKTAPKQGSTIGITFKNPKSNHKAEL